jgi:hypothetical protein
MVLLWIFSEDPLNRPQAVRLLYWFHDHEEWNREHTIAEHYVWPPFPRLQEMKDLRIRMALHRRCF